MSTRHWARWAMVLGLAFGCGDDSRSDAVTGTDAGRAADAGIRDASVVEDGAITDAFRVDASVVDASAADGSPAADADVPPAGGPDAPGAYAVAESSAVVGQATARAFVPAVPSGSRVPLVLFKHGFQLSTANYAQSLGRLASHGFVVIGVDGTGGFLGGPTNAEERDQMVAVLDWATGAAPFAAVVDPSAIGVAGHSRGGKVATMVAATDPRIGATLLLDPVNGCGPGSPFSASCPDVTGAAFAGAIAHPIGVMGETTDASGGFMPCAPADQNYQTIYAALDAPPSWKAQWTFTGADHMDFTDDGGGTFGSFCASGPGDDAQIRAAWRAMVVAFFRVHLAGDGGLEAWLTGPSLPRGIELVRP